MAPGKRVRSDGFERLQAVQIDPSSPGGSEDLKRSDELRKCSTRDKSSNPARARERLKKEQWQLALGEPPVHPPTAAYGVAVVPRA
jgi:hypothetical protein